jgi:hypothetical protein
MIRSIVLSASFRCLNLYALRSLIAMVAHLKTIVKLVVAAGSGEPFC